MSQTITETQSRAAATTTIEHWIDGASAAGDSERTGPVYNPALGVEQKRVRFASTQDVDAAVQAAARAFPKWRDTSIAKRQAVMFAFRELLNARSDELAAILTSEHGKVLSDAAGEIARGLEVVELACAMPGYTKGEYSENVSTGIDVYTTRQPVGVVGIISPFNFPAMVPLWFFPLAIATGNTVVLKPSEKDPSAAVWLAKLMQEAGLPDGVLNVVHGDKVAVDALLEHPTVRSISFVGSTPIAQYIYSTATANGKRVQALGGAKNHMLVLPDADLDLAADAAVNAGFGSAGERCMAISAVLAVDTVADQLVEKIAERMSRLKTGDGTRGCDMGPLITREHRDKVAGYLDVAASDGATVVDKVPTSSAVYRDEVFGPVLSVLRVEGYEDGLELINASRYGNGTAIFTNDGGAARKFQREVTVGMVGINVPIPVPVAYHSFGGWKDSLFGDAKAYGPRGFDFFTQEKAITSRWLDPSHGGLNLGFPQHD